MQNYSEHIINGIEQSRKKNEEAQLDFIVEELKNVPEEEHEEVMFRCAAYMTMSRTEMPLDRVGSWADAVDAEEDQADACFVARHDREWREAQQQAKRQRWFGAWDRWVSWARRVDMKRREKAMASRVIKKVVDKIALLLDERRDVKRNPAMYGSEEDCDRLISEYEDAICAIPTGKWRLVIVKQDESKALQPRIDEIVRQVKLTMALKETLAAKRIQTAWRSHTTDDEESVDYDDGNQPPRALHGVARRTHDDGFADDYDGEDEGETSSQEADRRQEMAENIERQMEEYNHQCDAGDQQCGYCLKTLDGCWCDEPDLRTGLYPDLNRAVFEYNSVPTSDPHVRIAHNVSPAVPDNWREIVSRSGEPPPITNRRFTKE